MSRTLDSDLLRTFVAIAETGNFTRAAERAGRTQSAVSVQMKKLESMVGAALFERSSRGVTLTKRGDDLIVNARRIVSLLEETEASMAGPPLGGPVRIGILEEYGSVLSQALAAFAKRHTDVEVTVRYSHSTPQLVALAAGKLDLAVVFEWQNFSDGKVLMDDPTVWVTSTRHDTHKQRPVPIALVNREGWSRDFAVKSLEQCGLAHRVAYISDTTGGLKLAAISGFAIAPLSRSSIPAGCRELTAADGFREIDSSKAVLRRHPSACGKAIDGMEQAIREVFAYRQDM